MIPKLNTVYEVNINDKYNPVFDFFRQNYFISESELCLLSICLGKLNNKKFEVNVKDRKKIRTDSFKGEDSMVVLSLLVNKLDFDFIFSGENINVHMQQLSEYANGGMLILTEELFKEQWNGEVLNSNYQFYLSDLLLYLYSNFK